MREVQKVLIGSRTSVAAAAVISLLLSSEALAANPARSADREALRRALSEVLERAPLKGSRVSVLVFSLDEGDVVFSRQADDLLNPASNVKLFTAAASLVKLGPEYRFETEFLVDPDYTASTGRAKTLYVRGKGDPTLTTERLYGILSELSHAGLREVGDVVIDDTWFDSNRLAPGFDQESSDRAYMAPTGAVSLNVNAVGVYLRSGGPGKKPLVELEPPSEFFTVESALVSGPRRYRRVSVSSEADGDHQRIAVRGTLPAEASVVSVWKKVDNPPLYFGYTLKELLARHGIKARGRVKLGTVPATARLLHLAQSDTLDLVLKRMNKSSSNFVAETLIKTLGAEVKGPPGSTARGIEVVEDLLEKEVGIARGSYVMKNGSGLNDTNRFSSTQIVRLLRYMYERFPLAPEYLSSMGIAAKDGTLRYRFEGTEAVGRLRAKTGTLENVSALSGYVQAVGGERFAFSTLVNDYTGRSSPVVQGIDALGVAVAASGSPRGPGVAVAELAPAPPLTGPIEEAKARIKTYLALGRQGDTRNLPFLRTAWRSERDPAVRVVVAESMFRSNPQDSLGARALLESLSAGEEAYGRLRRVAREMSMEVPGVGAVVELAAEGNTEALAKLVELSRAASGDAAAEQDLSTALAEVARTAPEELLHALRVAVAPDRDAAIALLARGLVRAADAEHPLWLALRKTMGSVEPGMSAFAHQLDGTLSVKIAQEKAPAPVASPPAGSPAPAGARSPETRPGG